MADLNVMDYSGVTKTNKGTTIVASGDNLDKNSFLTILAAELANQDPTQDVDSTQYVSQLASFTSLEQMSNLNTTMTKFANETLVGKGVTVSNLDADGKNYTGIVSAVNTNGSSTTITLQVNEGDKNVYKTFDIANVISVVNVDDYSIPPLTNINGNTSFLLASSFIDKNVELTEKDEDGNALSGKVIGVTKESGVVMVRVELTSGEIKQFTYDQVAKVGNFATTTEGSESTDSEGTSSEK